VFLLTATIHCRNKITFALVYILGDNEIVSRLDSLCVDGVHEYVRFHILMAASLKMTSWILCLVVSYKLGDVSVSTSNVEIFPQVCTVQYP
jgi:hypothetical protein